MSGIVGFFNLDGRPADERLLLHLTRSLAFRGPDDCGTWARGGVGFGHAMLRTTHESYGETQPCSLDGEVWITADARIDDREGLQSKMRGTSAGDIREATDAQLILLAYQTWGDHCVEHLTGDFAFAIWDNREQSLFCARDQLGGKPFYYAHLPNCFLFSNTLNCLRGHPGVSGDLNDLAIGDFLVFGANQDPRLTVFADIRRLPAAHTITCTARGVNQRRYWSLPREGGIHYKRRIDYVDHFNDLFQTAVRDRMRTDRIAFLMSGGLDSTSVAATAAALSRLQSTPVELEAYTVVYDELIPDQERRFSQAVGQSLQLRTNYLVADTYSLYQRFGERRLCPPEPYHEPFAALSADLFDQIGRRHRVVLAGYGGDAALCPSLVYFDRLLREFDWARLLVEAVYYLFARRRVPKFGIRQWFISRNSTAPTQADPPQPSWLNPDFAKRYDLLSRWREVEGGPEAVHPLRPEAYELLAAPYWQQIFESLDAEATQVACEVRNPFFDRRLLEYVLRVPPIPFCVQKDLLRVAMRDLLPAAITRRAKEPLKGNPYLARLKRGDTQFRDYYFKLGAEIAAYVKIDAVPRIADEGDMDSFWANTRPISLDNWLKNRHSFAEKYNWEVAYAKD